MESCTHRSIGASGLALIAGLAIAQLTHSAGAQIPLSPPRPQPVGQFGFAVAAIPDANGNGVWDFAVGAMNETHFQRRSGGRVHLFDGSNGGRMLTITPPRAQLLGSFGWALAGLEDVTGDGRGEIIIGAPWEAAHDGRISGVAYLYSGDGTLIDEWTSPYAETWGGFGWVTAAIADVNGDGIQDVAISAPFEAAEGRELASGRVYIFCGRTGEYIRHLLSPIGQELGGFGLSLAGIHDLDGDGVGEIVVGAPSEAGEGHPAGSGRVYIFSGASGDLIGILRSPHQEVGGRFGHALAVGDVTGNGQHEIIIGAPWERIAGLPARTGRAYIFDGATGRGIRRLLSPMPRQNGNFGTSIALINQESGAADIIVTAPGDAPLEMPARAGQAYRFSAGDFRLQRILRSRDPQLGGSFGASVASLPGGLGAFVIGAPSESASEEHLKSGRAYLFRRDR